MIDLSTIKSLDRAEIEITHPVSGEGAGAFFTLASPDHPARKQAIAEASRRLRAAGDGQDEDLLNELANEAAAASVLGWRGVKLDGAVLEYSQQAARDLLAKPEMKWLVNQLSAQLGRQANFIKTSAPG